MNSITVDQLAAELARRPEAMIAARQRLTRDSPRMFAEVYLRPHLETAEVGNQVSYSRFHLDLMAQARTWRKPSGIAENRDAYVAPRGAGKSTWGFLILPLWAAAHGHVKFVAAFADAGNQAEQHLMSFRRELTNNTLLRLDYPELCAPARTRVGTASDTKHLYLASSGFVFGAKGADASTLGMKVGAQRPDLILLDDIEPHESAYSQYQKEKRLDTILSGIFPMNYNARVVLIGTTTMAGSVVHDLVRTVTETDGPRWPAEENIRTHYYPAIETADDGTERSLWPERWSLEWLQARRGDRRFQKEMMNQPVAVDGGYWDEADFRHIPPANVTRKVLAVDPAVTAKLTSDYTGLAVVGHDPVERRCAVERVEQVKLSPASLRAYVLGILQRTPSIKAVLIEVNQGGETWPEIMGNLPVPVVPIHHTVSKTARAAQVLDWYQKGYVAHTGDVGAFEQQAMSFPKVVNDDMVDAVCSAVSFFLVDRDRPRTRSTASSYA